MIGKKFIIKREALFRFIKIINILVSNNFVVLILFLSLSIYLLYPTLVSPGIITGGDWFFPVTKLQLATFFEDTFSTWTRTSGLIGGYKSYMIDIPAGILFYLYGLSGFDITYIPKISLLFVYTLASFSMYVLLRYFKVVSYISLLGGIIYVTSPFFFNYSVMGWIYVLFSMSIFPLFIIFFHKGLVQSKIVYIFLASLIFSLAIIQSTSIVWYSLAVFALGVYYVRDFKTFYSYFLNSLLLYILFFLLQSSWLLNLFLFKDPLIFGSENVLSGISMGTWARLSLLNMLRGWGSLFNYSYETSYIKELFPFSFTLTLLSLLSLFLLKKRRLLLLFFLLFIFPFLFYFLGPYNISKLPFANIIRDVARMSVLISFSLTALSAFFLNFLHTRKYYLWLFITILCLFLNMHPFILMNMHNKSFEGPDIRLRTYEYPEEYTAIENYIYEHGNSDGKVVYVPLTSSLQDFNKDNFTGDYREMSYVYSSLSVMPGIMFITDKEESGINSYYRNLITRLYFDIPGGLEDILSNLNIKYFVFYHNSMSAFDWKLKSNLDKSDLVKDITSNITQSDKVSVYEVGNPSLEISYYTDPVYTNAPAKYSYYIKSKLLESEHRLLVHLPKLEPKYSDNLVYLSKPDTFGDSVSDYVAMPAWPYVSHNPTSFIYRFVRFSETLTENLTFSKTKKMDLYLWHAIKRVSEIETFSSANQEILEREYTVGINKIFSELRTNKNSFSYEWMEEYIKRLSYYVYRSSVTLNRTEELVSFKELYADTYGEFGNKQICFPVPKNIIETSELLPFDENLTKLQDTSNCSLSPLNSSSNYDYYSYKERPELVYELTQTSEFSSDLPKKNHVAAFESVLSNLTFTDLYNSFQNVHYISVPGIESNMTYTVDIKYIPADTSISLLTIADINKVNTKKFVENSDDMNIYLSSKLLNNSSTAKSSDFLLSKIFADSTVQDISFDITIDELEGSKLYIYFIGDANLITAFVKGITVSKKQPIDGFFTNFSNDSKVSNSFSQYTKVNNSTYIVSSVPDTTEDFALTLKQRYNSGWEIFVRDREVPFKNTPLETFFLNSISNDKHFIGDGYNNTWLLNKTDIPDSSDLILQFVPQRTTILGLYISLTTLILILIYFLFYFFKNYMKQLLIYRNYFLALISVISQNGVSSIPLFFSRFFTYSYYKLFKKNTYEFNGSTYSYFYHWYNVTFRNERCVEIPIAKKYIEKYASNEVFEVGNVLSHYLNTSHTVLDKYEDSKNTIREDIVDYKSARKYDFVVSISTLEHVGWDEDVRSPKKFLKAIDKVIAITKEDGDFLITMPMGWSSYVDDFIKKGKFGNYKISFLKRISSDNRWVQVDRKDIVDSVYNKPFPNANALIVIEKTEKS